ncbi:MAG TPA: DUF2335 domain-containing protein [Longimicrobium sp.]|nr:DUF2335 domain-containing protein [Longimicrobium sp.]
MGKHKDSPAPLVAVAPPPARQPSLKHEEPRAPQVMVARSLFSGPVPPPDLLAEYELIVPGAAKYFFEALERQSLHRQEMERTAFATAIRHERMGMWLAFVIAMVVIASGTFLIHEDKDPQGLSLIVVTMASLCEVFVYSRAKRRAEGEAKQAEGVPVGA